MNIRNQWSVALLATNNQEMQRPSLKLPSRGSSCKVSLARFGMVLALTLMLTLMLTLKKILMSKAVWKILDGVGDAVDGTVEEISAFLFERLNKQAEGG